MEWFWYFLFYSFLGFLLEVGYAWWTDGPLDRKCLLLLPLCPVYGLGACAVLLLPGAVLRSPRPPGDFGRTHRHGGGVRRLRLLSKGLLRLLLDYHGQLGNLNGRVCLPFTLAWGLLLLPMVYWVHPAAARLFAMIPPPVSWAALAAFTADGIVSSVILRRTGDRTRLQWYRAAERPQ